MAALRRLRPPKSWRERDACGRGKRLSCTQSSLLVTPGHKHLSSGIDYVDRQAVSDHPVRLAKQSFHNSGVHVCTSLHAGSTFLPPKSHPLALVPCSLLRQKKIRLAPAQRSQHSSCSEIQQPSPPDAAPRRSGDYGWASLDQVPFYFALRPHRYCALPAQRSMGLSNGRRAGPHLASTLRGGSDKRPQVALGDALLLLPPQPPRGGRRGRAHAAHRFDAWARGDLAQLVHWWEFDGSASASGRHRVTSARLTRR